MPPSSLKAKPVSDYAIDIQNLVKTYAPSGKAGAKDALKGIDLQIPKGSIFGLLGPNGAGKSTLINIMAGLVVKTSGTVKIWDRDMDVNPRNARAAIGVVAQELTFDPFFSPRKMLDIQAGLYGVPKENRRSMELLDLVGLKDKAEAYTRSLSGGMKRRLMIAKSLVHNPPILVLDEPTAGVDVELRQMLWEKVRMLNEQGVTILLTTHYLEEAQELCDQIAIINHGRIVANDTTEKLLSRIDNKEIHFRVDRDLSSLPSSLSAFSAELIDARSVKVRYAPGEQPVNAIITALQAEGLQIVDLSTVESDLEDVFLQITRAA